MYHCSTTHFGVTWCTVPWPLHAAPSCEHSTHLHLNLFTAWEDAIWRPCITLHCSGTQGVKEHVPIAFPIHICENP